MKKRVVLGAVLLSLAFAMTGCKGKVNPAYYEGQANASAAFEVKGNAELDEAATEGNLGLAASDKVDTKEKRLSGDVLGNQETSAAAGGSSVQSGTIYELYINTDTLQVHKRECEMGDMSVPTFRRYHGTVADAAAEGYPPCSFCLE